MNFSLDIVDTFTSLPKAEIYHHKVLGRAKKHWHARDALACVFKCWEEKARAHTHTHTYILNSYYFRYVFKYVYIFNFKKIPMILKNLIVVIYFENLK